MKRDPNLPGEISKYINQNVPELQQMRHPSYDEESSREFKIKQEFQESYMRQKWKWYVDSRASQMEMVYDNLKLDEEYAKEHDKRIKTRITYMFNYLDVDNDRGRATRRFLNKMNKKTTLKDIGYLLDKFMIESKANIGKYYDPAVHTFEKPHLATVDHDNTDLHWKG